MTKRNGLPNKKPGPRVPRGAKPIPISLSVEAQARLKQLQEIRGDRFRSTTVEAAIMAMPIETISQSPAQEREHTKEEPQIASPSDSTDRPKSKDSDPSLPSPCTGDETAGQQYHGGSAAEDTPYHATPLAL